MKKKKNKKIILIVISCLFVIITAWSIGYICNRKNTTNSIKEIVEYMGCTYYNDKMSEESGFFLDIYVSIPIDPIDKNDGNSNQYFYERLIKAVSTKMQGHTFRIIDEQKNLVIRIKEENKNVSYTINGNKHFFESELVKDSQDTIKNEKNTNLEVNSIQLETLISNNWSRAQSRNVLGTADEHLEDYDQYIDEGYEIKTRNTKVFNIVFTKNYSNEVFKGIKTGLTNREIKNILGDPTYENEDAEMLVGYKTEAFYVFFCEGQISIYRNENNGQSSEDNAKFASLVTELNQNRNYNEFISKLTELYPDYDKYNSNGNQIEITYPLRGFKVEINDYRKGITIYNNYTGKVFENMNMEELAKEQELPSNIFYNRNNSVFEYELIDGICSRMIKIQ